ncbi:MAG: mannose-1-phosphate guanylyltransferase/mannose-6-phosphate isomerase [Nitrospirota bacterium]
MKVFILAGGSGTRLWPLSRKHYPKQFLKLNGDASLLQQTARRVSGAVRPEDIVIITNSDYKFHVRSDMSTLFSDHPEHNVHILLEPAGRNTAPAIALGIKFCMERLGSKGDEVVFVSPSDHIIKPAERFPEYMMRAEDVAQEGFIVTFGIKPYRPETGYGYIKAGKDRGKGTGTEVYSVEEFTEKPELETAQRYISEGGYFWNSGMFAFRIDTMLEELGAYAPQIREMCNKPFDEMAASFTQMPDISIDYAVAEKSKRVVTLPLDCYWNDIGSWDALCEVLSKDPDGNIALGNILTVDTKDSLIIGNKRLISTIGLEGHLIIETDDAILIAKKGEAQKVKDVVKVLQESGRKEVEEHVTTYRPWGSYTILEEGPRYKIKRIVVNPGAKLSLQMHYHRSEHWVVVTGAAKVTIGDKEIFVHENESAYVPKSTLHRLENPGRVPLEIIEVQNGEYVGEDDIQRIEDVYDRKSDGA